jgi:hypothetical protein
VVSRLIDPRDREKKQVPGTEMTEEQLYSLHDANNNVTAVVNNAGAVVERFTYTP